MRAFVPSQIPNDLDYRLVKILRDMGGYLEQVDKGLSAIQRGASPSGGGGGGVSGGAGLVDHHKLLNLTTYDDHSQYAYLPGRVDGQTLYGAIPDLGGVAGTWANGGDFTSKNSKVATASWAGIVIDTSAAVGDIIVLQLSTTAFAAATNGQTANHISITDTKGNTWTKLREYQYSDSLQNGPCTSIWTCTVTTALVAGVDTLTATYTSSIGAMAISSHRFLMAGFAGAAPVVAGLTFLGEQGFVGSEPSVLSLSGLESSIQYLFIRFNAEGNIGSNVVGPLTGSTNYTAFNNGTSFTSGGTGNVGSFPEYRIVSATSDTTNPSMGASGGYFVSVYVALAVYPDQTTGLTLAGSTLPNSSKIELIGQPLRLYGRNIGFRDVGGSTDLSYIRAQDGGLVDKLVLASEATTDPSTPLKLRGFDNGPVIGTNSITSRSAEIRVGQYVKVLADYLLVAERSDDYGTTDGFYVATGLGFVNISTKGSETITGHASGGSPVLLVDQGNQGLTVVTTAIRKRASQTGNMTEWQDEAGVAMSYIRASDGAFVGPVVPTPALDHGGLLGLADDDHTQYLLLAGRSTGQRIGTATQTGNTDDIATSGRVSIGTGTYATEQVLVVQNNLTNTTGTRQLVRITPSITANGGAATYRGILVQISGGNSWTSGAPTVKAMDLIATCSPNAAVSIVEILGLDMQAAWAPTSSSATVGAIMGLRGKAYGGSTNFGDTFTQTQVVGIWADVSPGGPKTQDTYGLKLAMSTTTKQYGYSNRTVGISLDSFGDTIGTTFGNGVYTCTVTGASNILTNVTNAASIHVGQYITGTNIPAGTYVTAVNVGALQVTMNNNASGAGTSVSIWGTTGHWVGISCDPTLPIGGEVIKAHFLGSAEDIPSQLYGRLYLRPASPATYPTATAYLHIGAGAAAASSAPIKLTSGTSLTTPEAGAIEFTTDDIFFTITTGAARKAFVLDDGTRLTSGRVPFATTNGRLTDDADFTFATDTLTVTKIAATTLTGLLTFADAVNIAFNGTTGTKIATATTQKFAFWNATPVVQPTTGITAATFVANTSGIADDTATWDGYTIGQVVAALRQVGLLA